VTSADSSDHPFTTIGYGGDRSDFVYGWVARKAQNGSQCVVFRQELAGAETVVGTISRSFEDAFQNLAYRGGSARYVASPTSPSLVSAVFGCEDPILSGDRVSGSVRFFVPALGFLWTAVDYDFTDLIVEGG
jgi:hypothetical protein